MSNSNHRCGWVALMGPPNAGKSTLLNSFLGQKVAIVTPKPQTTRNQISGILSDADAQVIFLDTPGVHQLKGKMNRMLVQSAWQAMSGADAILVILDTDHYLKNAEEFEQSLEPLREVISREKRPVAVAVNKIDLFHDKSRMLPLLEKLHELWPEAEIFPVSALHGEGLPALLKFIKQGLPVAPAQYPADQLSTVPLKFMAAEIIREKLFLSLKQELPYYTAVEIEKWEDKTSSKSQDPLTIIHAVVYVGRTSHKGMVIGKGGAKLKEISTASRKDIEELLGHKVFLEVWVKVREGWSEDPSFLQFMSQASDELLPLEDGQSIDFGEEPGEDFDPSLLPSMFAEHLQEEHSPEPPVALPKVKNKLKK
jgi:GTP-binding protein Era